MTAAKTQIILSAIEDAIAQGCSVSMEIDGESCVEPTTDTADMLAILREIDDHDRGAVHFFRFGCGIGSVCFSDCVPTANLEPSALREQLS